MIISLQRDKPSELQDLGKNWLMGSRWSTQLAAFSRTCHAQLTAAVRPAVSSDQPGNREWPTDFSEPGHEDARGA
jgi:hypothetical protein